MEAKYKKCSSEALKTLLIKRQLTTNGDREDWVKRLMEFDDGATGGYISDETPTNQTSNQTLVLPKVLNRNGHQQKNDANMEIHEQVNSNIQIPAQITNNIGFSDVLAGLRKFSGDDHADIMKWIDNYEETADLMNWTNMQRLIFARRSLTGTASLMLYRYIQTGHGVN